jgi:VanZ family protein
MYLARIALLLILVTGGYIALQPEYNTAHWTPNQTMRKLGLPYRMILAYEHYLPWALHFLVALALTLLLFFSKLFYPQDPNKRIATGFFMLIGLMLTTELLQSYMGRNFQVSDLAIGLAGTGVATLVLVNARVNKSRHTSK